MLGDLLAGRDGTLVALYEMAGDAGAVGGPVAAGFLVDTASYTAAFELAAAVLGLAAALGLFAPETRSRNPRLPAGGQPASPPPSTGCG